MSRRERWFVAASLVVGMVLSVVLGSAGIAVFDGALAQGTTDSEPAARMQETAARSAVEVVQQVSPAVVTVINTGIDGGLPWRWLLAWSIACPAAIVAAYLFRPLAWRAACLVSRMTLR